MASSNAIARKISKAPGSHDSMIDGAIEQLHNDSSIPKNIGIAAMHALLLAKHFHSKGLKVPDHLNEPPKSSSSDKSDNNKSSDKNDSDGDEDSGD